MLITAAVLALTLAEPVCEPCINICATVEVAQDVTSSDQTKSGDQKKGDDQDQSSEERTPPTPEHTGVHGLVNGVIEDFRHLPAVDNLYVALAGGAVALTAHQWDSTFNTHLRSHYTLVNDLFWPAKYYGDTRNEDARELGEGVLAEPLLPMADLAGGFEARRAELKELLNAFDLYRLSSYLIPGIPRARIIEKARLAFKDLLDYFAVSNHNRRQPGLLLLAFS